VLVGVGETDGAATGPVNEPVGVGEPDGVADELGLGVEVVVGEADGDVVAQGYRAERGRHDPGEQHRLKQPEPLPVCPRGSDPEMQDRMQARSCWGRETLKVNSLIYCALSRGVQLHQASLPAW
jgi:hypothetical protein